MKITIGLDLAKHWLQVHGGDAQGKAIVRRSVSMRRRPQRCHSGLDDGLSRLGSAL